jgi:hypothetical protein
MKVAAAKAALLPSGIRVPAAMPFAALPYDETKLDSLKDATFDDPYSVAGKLLAIPEAMCLSAKALRLRGGNS